MYAFKGKNADVYNSSIVHNCWSPVKSATHFNRVWRHSRLFHIPEPNMHKPAGAWDILQVTLTFASELQSVIILIR